MTDHGAILQRVMRALFRPQGFLQVGRSRTWLADRGWWVAVIELQPSGWSKGSYLNVGAMWLVYPNQHVVFHDGYRQKDCAFVPFKNPQQFEEGVRGLCAVAVDRVADLTRTIRSYADAHARQERLLEEEMSRAGPPGPWNLYYTAAFGLLAGHHGRLEEMLARLEAHQARWDWEHSMKAVALETLRSSDARALLHRHVRTTRAALRLPLWESDDGAGPGDADKAP